MGSGGVGKSAVTVRFINGSYLEWYDPTIEDSCEQRFNSSVKSSIHQFPRTTDRKQFTVDAQACLLEILDTAGIDQYLALNDLFIRESEGFILVFALNQPDSLEEVIRTRENILRIKVPHGGTSVPLVIVGNKSDLVEERNVSTVEVQTLAEKWGCNYFETSARKSSNITPVFEDIVRQMRRLDTGRRDREGRRKRGKNCVIL
ncbi:hypothetical protein P7C73_g2676, partial [Tremellales sp. Uapishka_1]